MYNLDIIKIAVAPHQVTMHAINLPFQRLRKHIWFNIANRVRGGNQTNFFERMRAGEAEEALVRVIHRRNVTMTTPPVIMLHLVEGKQTKHTVGTRHFTLGRMYKLTRMRISLDAKLFRQKPERCV